MRDVMMEKIQRAGMMALAGWPCKYLLLSADVVCSFDASRSSPSRYSRDGCSIQDMEDVVYNKQLSFV